MKKLEYIKQLTLLRFLAALLIVIFHFGQQTWPFNTSYLSNIVKNGSIGVSFFFFLSGTVLSINYFNSPIYYFNFMLKRLARIFPVYFLALISTIILVHLYRDYSLGGLSVYFELLMIHAWLPNIALGLNFPGWSISVEIFFYILFPFISILLKRFKYEQIILIVLTVWLLSLIQNIYFINHPQIFDSYVFERFTKYFPLWHLNTFVFGILSGIYIKKNRTQGKMNSYRIMYIISIAAILMIISTDNSLIPYIHNGLLSPLYFFTIVGLALDNSIITKLMSQKIFLFLGNISYSMYILQFPVYILYSAWLKQNTTSGVFFFLYLVLLVIISIIVYLLIERLIQKIILKRWLRD